MNPKIKLTIAGSGFVGLITGAVFADRGYQVTVLDIDEEKIAKVNAGQTFFFEPHLDTLLKRVVLEKETLTACKSTPESLISSDVTFICVGTPPQEDGSCNLQYIHQIATDIGKAVANKDSYHLIVVKSTVIPETTRNFVKPILEKESGKKAGEDFGLCMSPEFLREGQSVHDMVFPDRIIIGEFDSRSGESLALIFEDLYQTMEDNFSKNWEKTFSKKVSLPTVLRFTLETAECIKYANNSFLATKISFINEMANICERIPGVDVKNIAKGIGLDPRINEKFLGAGAGFGGSCFPKDVNAIIHYAKTKNYEPKLLTSVLEINDHQAKRMVELTEEKLGAVEGKTIALLGLSFKPETDDMRNAPSIKIIEQLLVKGAKIVAWDPKAIHEAKKNALIGNKIRYTNSIDEAIKDADACLLITEWAEFKELKPEKFKQMKTPILIDGRRIYEPDEFLKEGITYAGIGLGLKD
ncbi:MAG TPA: UDP-glucose/GDP-mannose dehydrogenase family protein [Candidatus Bathyarchaeia archaeon]|nr:UDP-glucose/GDP-mannose dehydrogenase family protein [Candidatus Bathyarchaeia archaeon]